MSWQDYRGWRTQVLDEPRPTLFRRDFSDRAYAESELSKLRIAGMTTCITPLPTPKPRRRVEVPSLPLRFVRNEDENDGRDMTAAPDQG